MFGKKKEANKAQGTPGAMTSEATDLTSYLGKRFDGEARESEAWILQGDEIPQMVARNRLATKADVPVHLSNVRYDIPEYADQFQRCLDQMGYQRGYEPQDAKSLAHRQALAIIESSKAHKHRHLQVAQGKLASAQKRFGDNAAFLPGEVKDSTVVVHRDDVIEEFYRSANYDPNSDTLEEVYNNGEKILTITKSGWRGKKFTLHL